MPIVLAPLQETEQSITRPVVFSILQEFINITKLPQNLKIFYNDELLAVPNNTVDTPTRDPLFINTDLITIQIRESFYTELIPTTNTTIMGNFPLFLDNKLGIRITPVYSPIKIELTITYKTTSKNEALSWYNQLFIRLTQMLDSLWYHVKYHYSVPPSVLSLLKQIHQYREQLEPYEEFFSEYLTKNSNQHLTQISDITGQITNLVFDESQYRVQGFINDLPLSDRATRDESTGQWITTINHVVQYDKPTAVQVGFPIMIHNQILPDLYIDFIDTNNELKNNYQIASQNSLFFGLENNHFALQSKPLDMVINIPSIDRFEPNNEPYGIHSYLHILTSLEEDKRGLVNLLDLEEFSYDSDILTFMKESEYPYMTKEYKSIIYVGQLKNQSYQRNTLLSDKNLNISLLEDGSYRNVHRVSFGVLFNLNLLDLDGWRRLNKYPDAKRKLIDAINYLLSREYNYRNQVNFIRYTYDVNQYNRNKKPTTGTNGNGVTVNFASIIARRNV